MLRIVFDFQPSEGRPVLDWQDRLPADFTIQRINTEIAEQLQRDLVASGGKSWFDTVWGGIENFLKEGFGFAVLYEGAVVSKRGHRSDCSLRCHLTSSASAPVCYCGGAFLPICSQKESRHAQC
jgi:hypothetical protein